MNKQTFTNARSLFWSLRIASGIGLFFSSIIFLGAVFISNMLTSIYNERNRADAASRVAAISLESSRSLSAIKRQMASVGASRDILGIYLISRNRNEIVASSSHASDPELINYMREEVAQREAKKDPDSLDSVREILLHDSIVVAQDVVIENFSGHELESGKYIYAMVYRLNIFDAIFFKVLGIFSTALGLAMMTVLMIQMAALKKMFLKPFREFVEVLRNWNSDKIQVLKSMRGEGELIHLRDSFVSMFEGLEIERSKSMHTAKLASLGEMSASIAHEINNPLAVISGSAQLLAKYRDDEQKFKSKIELTLKAVSRIEKIVKGLKKFARSSATVDLKIESLDTIITEALTLAEPKLKRFDTQVTLDLAPNLHLFCDQVEIEQVIINMLNNAVDAIKSNEKRWIKICAFEEGEHTVLRVIDSGYGISPDIEDKLFQPFFTTKAVGEGTGLGLSIAKGILDNHRATISVNRNFRNTCFEIKFLPVKKEEVKSVA